METFNRGFGVPSDAVLLMSGGLDSFIVWRLLGEPKSLYFWLNTNTSHMEMERLKKINLDLGGNIIVSDHLFKTLQHEFEMTNGYMPYRNLFFLLQASLLYPDVALIFPQVLEWQTDKNIRFYRRVERLFKELGKRNNVILSPFRKFTKIQMVKIYLDKGFSKKELTEYSYSCQYSSGIHCGKCSNCLNRYIAFSNNGIEEDYEVQPSKELYVQNIKNQKSLFSIFRINMYVRRFFEIRGVF